MRIAFVDEDLSPRTGSRRFTCEITPHLQSLGHEVEIFTTKLDTRTCFQEYLSMPINVVPEKKTPSNKNTKDSRIMENQLLKIPIASAYLLRKMRSALEISERIANAQFDATLFHYHGEHWLLPYFYCLSEPLGMVYLNVVPPMPRPLALPFQEMTLRRRLVDRLFDTLPFRRLEQVGLRKLSMILTPSRFQLEQARRQGIIGRRKTAVVPLGVDHSRFYPTHEEEPFALYLGRIHPHKSLELAVMAMKKTPESCSLIIAGDIEPQYLWYKSQLDNLAEEIGISHRFEIILSPSDSEVMRLMQKCSVFLFPSTIDTFGLVVLEAMACGKPVIACNRGGVPEVLGDTGILVEPTPKQWQSSLMRLLLDDSLRQELGKKASERSQEFSWKSAAFNLLRSLNSQ